MSLPTHTEHSIGSRPLLVTFAAVAVVNVLATAVDNSLAHDLTTALIVPLLAAWMFTESRRPLPPPLRLLTFGLVFAWCGDLALLGSGDVRFILGIALFLVMQVCYIGAFRRVPGPGLVRAWPLALVPYVLLWCALATAMVLTSGAAALPGLVYGVVLVTMAVSALDLVIRVKPQRNGWHVAIGAALFMISDALIALTAFAGVSSSPALSAAVMATYAAAQYLIVTGFTRANAQAG